MTKLYDGGDHEGEKLLVAALGRLDYRRRHGGKRCSRCGLPKTVREYGPDARRNDGLRSACRVCEAEKARDPASAPLV